MWTLDAESGRAPHKILIKCILQLNPAERCSELALGGNDLRSQGSLGSCRCTHSAVGGFLVDFVLLFFAVCSTAAPPAWYHLALEPRLVKVVPGLFGQMEDAKCKMQEDHAPTNQLEAIETQRHNFSFSFFSSCWCVNHNHGHHEQHNLGTGTEEFEK